MKIKKNAIEFKTGIIPYKTDEEWNHNAFYLVNMLCTEFTSALQHLNTDPDPWLELDLADGTSTTLSIVNISESDVNILIGDKIMESGPLVDLAREFLDNARADIDDLLDFMEDKILAFSESRIEILASLAQLEVLVE